jgi:hypothetical protein
MANSSQTGAALLHNLQKHRRMVAEYLSFRTKAGVRTAISLLSNYAASFTLKSVAAYFGVSLRRVKFARLHESMFGPGAPVPEVTCAAHCAWRIPPGKLTKFMSFLSRKDMLRVLPSSRTGSAAKGQIMQLRCSKSDFLRMFKGEVGSDALSKSTVYKFFKLHGIANMSSHDCLCAQCMDGTGHLDAAVQLMQDLHARCCAIRGTDAVNSHALHDAAAEPVTDFAGCAAGTYTRSGGRTVVAMPEVAPSGYATGTSFIAQGSSAAARMRRGYGMVHVQDDPTHMRHSAVSHECSVTADEPRSLGCVDSSARGSAASGQQRHQTRSRSASGIAAAGHAHIEMHVSRPRARSASARSGGGQCAQPPSHSDSLCTPQQALHSTAIAEDITSPLRLDPPAGSTFSQSWVDASAGAVNPYNAFVPLPALAELAEHARQHCRFNFSQCCSSKSTQTYTGQQASTSAAAAARDASPGMQSDNALHCRNHALSELTDASSNCSHKCAKAGHTHAMNCKDCNSIIHVLSYIDGMLDALAATSSSLVTSNEVAEWREQCDEHVSGIRLFLAHKLRATHQEAAREVTAQGMGYTWGIVVIDWMQKWLATKRSEVQSDAFAKTGTSLHGACMIVKRLPPELANRAEQWDTLTAESQHKLQQDIEAADAHADHGYEVVSILTPSCSDHQQDAWLTCAHWEAALQQALKLVPWLRKLSLQCDNAGNYHCSQFLDQAAGIADLCGMELVDVCFNEPGEGKDLCDGAFNMAKSPVRHRIARSDGNMSAPTSLHLAAIASLNPPAGMTFAACKSVRSNAATSSWVWPTMSGIRKYHHFRYMAPSWTLATAASSKSAVERPAGASVAEHAKPANQHPAPAQPVEQHENASSKRPRRTAALVATVAIGKQAVQSAASSAAPAAGTAAEAEPQAAAHAVSKAEFNELVARAKVASLRAVLLQNGKSSSGKKQELADAVRALYKEQKGKLDLSILRHGIVIPPGRPVVAFKHYAFGTGEEMTLSHPACKGLPASGTYSTGAVSLPVADALLAADVQIINGYARQLKMTELQRTVISGSTRQFGHLPGARRGGDQDGAEAQAAATRAAMPAQEKLGQQSASGDSSGSSSHSSTNTEGSSDIDADNGGDDVHASDSEDFDAECDAADAERERQRVDKRARDTLNMEMVQDRDRSWPCPHEDCRRKCQSQHGLALHMIVCAELGPTGHKRQRQQLQMVNLPSEIAKVRAAGVAMCAPVSAQQAVQGSAPLDVYVLCAGNHVLRLPQPKPWPQGWAARGSRSVVRKTPAQLLLLVEEFLNVKAKGKQGRSDEADLLERANLLGPKLTKAQLHSHHSALENKWRTNRATVRAAAQTLREAVGNEVDLDQAEAAAVLAEEAFELDEAVQRHQVMAGDIGGGELDTAAEDDESDDEDYDDYH